MVPVEPGLTNVEKEENGQRIVGMNTENAEINEGLIRFDIIFYVSRLVSSQKERDFVKTNSSKLIGIHSLPSQLCPIGKNIHNVLDCSYEKIRNDLCQSLESITLGNIISDYHRIEHKPD